MSETCPRDFGWLLRGKVLNPLPKSCKNASSLLIEVKLLVMKLVSFQAYPLIQGSNMAVQY